MSPNPLAVSLARQGQPHGRKPDVECFVEKTGLSTFPPDPRLPPSRATVKVATAGGGHASAATSAYASTSSPPTAAADTLVPASTPASTLAPAPAPAPADTLVTASTPAPDSTSVPASTCLSRWCHP